MIVENYDCGIVQARHHVQEDLEKNQDKSYLKFSAKGNEIKYAIDVYGLHILPNFWFEFNKNYAMSRYIDYINFFHFVFQSEVEKFCQI